MRVCAGIFDDLGEAAEAIGNELAGYARLIGNCSGVARVGCGDIVRGCTSIRRNDLGCATEGVVRVTGETPGGFTAVRCRWVAASWVVGDPNATGRIVGSLRVNS